MFITATRSSSSTRSSPSGWAVFDAVPFTAEDLPGFAGALFDHLLASPKLLRLGNWDQLERTDPPATEIAQFREKIEAIARAQKRGVITTDLEPADLLVLLLGMVTSRFYAAHAVLDPATEDAWSPQCLHRHRVALTTAVRRLVAPSEDPQPYDSTDTEKSRQG